MTVASPAAIVQTAPARLTREQAQQCITRINYHAGSLRAAVLELERGEGWLALGYTSLFACAAVEIDRSIGHVYKLLTEAKTEERISPRGEIGTINGSVLAAVAKVPEEKQKQVYEQAREIASPKEPSVADVNAVIAVLSASPPIGEDDDEIDPDDFVQEYQPASLRDCRPIDPALMEPSAPIPDQVTATAALRQSIEQDTLAAQEAGKRLAEARVMEELKERYVKARDHARGVYNQLRLAEDPLAEAYIDHQRLIETAATARGVVIPAHKDGRKRKEGEV